MVSRTSSCHCSCGSRMSMSERRGSSLTRRRLLGGLAAGGLGVWAGPAAAAAPRRLTLIRQETDEVAHDVTFWRDGRPDDEGVARLDWLLRDVRAGKVTPIHHRVYRLLELVQADFGDKAHPAHIDRQDGYSRPVDMPGRAE